MPEYFKIGKLVASHGLKGELVLQHSLGRKTSLKGLETIFVELTRDNLLPYFIKATRIKNEQEIYVALDGVDLVEQARKLTPRDVWLEEADFKKYSAASAPISLLGYMLVSNGEDLGLIEEVIEQPHQILCTITYKGKQAYIPVHADSLEKVDKKNRKVYVSIPDGLLEIYQ